MDHEQLIRDAQDTQNRRRCRYILNRGAQCGSPALRGTNLCYFHSEHRGSPDQVRERRARHNSIILPPRLQTRADIQQALATTAIAIAGDDIDPRRAGLLLYALQIASCNLNEHQNNHFRQLPNDLQHLAEDPDAAAKELARQQQHESHPHYGTGPRPQFTPEGEPISTAEGYVSAERKAHEESLPDFTPRPAHWTRLADGVGPLLLEALGKHHSKDQPLPGKPSDRRNPHSNATPAATPIVQTLSDDETQPMVIAAMQATATEEARTSHTVSSPPKRSEWRDLLSFLTTTTLSFRAKPRNGVRATPASPPRRKPRVPHISAQPRCGFAGCLPNSTMPCTPKICHPDRSAAKWRDLLFLPPSPPPCHPDQPRVPHISAQPRCGFAGCLQNSTMPALQKSVIPTEAQRSGGTCGIPVHTMEFDIHPLDRKRLVLVFAHLTNSGAPHVHQRPQFRK